MENIFVMIVQVVCHAPQKNQVRRAYVLRIFGDSFIQNINSRKVFTVMKEVSCLASDEQNLEIFAIHWPFRKPEKFGVRG